MGKYSFFNRELSWIQFNRRVLEEAVNPNHPLLERGKFLSICSSNLDEFFMVRIGSLAQAAESGSKKKDAAGMTPKAQLEAAVAAVRKQTARQMDIIQNDYLPALKGIGIHLLAASQLNHEQTRWLSGYFEAEVLPQLTPRAIDARRPFPLLAARRLHMAVLLPPILRTGAPRFALVPLPSLLPRVVFLPMGIGKARGILLEDVVTLFAKRLFGGVQPITCMAFRITRNTDFLYNDSDADALIIEMRKNLKRRKWGKVVRVEVAQGFDRRLMSRLKRYIDFTDAQVIEAGSFINPGFFMKQFASLPGFDEHRYPPLAPYTDERLLKNQSIFRTIREGDLFFHHPYDSFDPIVRFVLEAAEDPRVVAIKQTLYRVSGKSPIVAALSRAAQQGKQVTVLIEVRARFDEENNINWCLELEKAGCHVVYGVANLKAHSKITLVVRREEQGLRSYVHLGTGNYNDVTARLYTDMGILTCDDTLGRDAGVFFNTVTGYAEINQMQKLIVAPHGLRAELQRLIEREIQNAQDGLPAAIVAKMNSLVDPGMIKLLYRAADEGVEVDLIVRGICCLKTAGRPNLHVRSIVGRFLEHARVFLFENGGEHALYMSSADWMPRNLDKRVELMFPIEDAAIKTRVEAVLQTELADNTQAWTMKKSGKYRKVQPQEPVINCQSLFTSRGADFPSQGEEE